MTMTRSLTPVLARRLVALLAAAALLSAGCGGDGDGDADRAPAGADPGAFPVTIEHQHGTTEIPSAPQRVVTVGLRDQDFVLALGVEPVGTTEWFGNFPGAIFPWARDEVSGALPKMVGRGAELNFEQIAALRPDLILGVYSGMTERDYETLSQIAPTVADAEGFEDYAVPWQVQLRISGEALGRSERANEITTELEREIADAAQAHPEFEGKTIVYGGFEVIGRTGSYTSIDQRGRFLEELGFDLPDEIDALATEEFPYFAEFSKERFERFDQDVAILVGPGAERQDFIAEDPLYGRLEVVRDGRAVYVNDQGAGGLLSALTFASPLSIPNALREVVPRLAAAADGDPQTEVEPDDTVTND